MDANPNYRLDMTGLGGIFDPFEFYFEDPATGEVLVDQRNQTLVMQVKFMMIDLKLPT